MLINQTRRSVLTASKFIPILIPSQSILAQSAKRYHGHDATDVPKPPVLKTAQAEVPKQLPQFMPLTEDFPDYKIPKDFQFPQKRDPYGVYDDPQNRRNFGEPLHPYQDMIDVWGPDHNDFVEDKVAVKQFAMFFAGLLSFAGAIYVFDLWPDRPNMPRSYPYEGLYRDLGGKEGEQELFGARVDKGL